MVLDAWAEADFDCDTKMMFVADDPVGCLSNFTQSQATKHIIFGFGCHV